MRHNHLQRVTEFGGLIMAIKQNQVDRCLDTITAICRSPAVDHYLIGFTSRSAARRGYDYRYINKPFDHLVILADRMRCKNALDLEEKLQTTILNEEEDKRRVVYRKYH